MVESTNAIIARSRLDRRPFFDARRLTLAIVGIGTLIGLVASLRLTAVVLTTPSDMWLQTFAPLVRTPSLAKATGLVNAEAIGRIFADPGLFPGQQADCFDESDEHAARCLALIEATLDVAPTRAELWLFKATILARRGMFGDELWDALRACYSVAPHEGWVAAHRVVVGLTMYQALPRDLQALVRGDLGLVLSATSLADALINTYANSDSFRTNAADALSLLPAAQLEWFVHNVRRAARNAIPPALPVRPPLGGGN